MSIFGPAGLDRNNGTRTDPHSAAGTGTHPGACATLPARDNPNEGAPAAVGSADRARLATSVAPTVQDSGARRITHLPRAGAGPGKRVATGLVEVQPNVSVTRPAVNEGGPASHPAALKSARPPALRCSFRQQPY